MFRKFLGLVGASLVAFSLYAETEVSGVISEDAVWGKSGSPYIVVGHVLVDSHATLTIEPGVEVRLDSAKYIMIKGTLNAIGTETDSIIITKNGASNWSTLWFKDSLAAGSLKYCRIEYAGEGEYGKGGIYIEGKKSPVYIGYSTIINNDCSGISGGSDSLVIENNVISHNSGRLYGGGIDCSGSPVIANNVISHNSAANGGGISCSGSPVIADNIISYNSADENGGGINAASGASPTITGNTITNNTILRDYSLGGGICCFRTQKAIITENTISNNKALHKNGEGSGIWCSGDLAEIRRNTIIGNSHRGIDCWVNGKAIIGENFISNSGCNAIRVINGNSIRIIDNIIIDTTASAIWVNYIKKDININYNTISATGYAVYNEGELDIDGRYNYWGVASSDEVEEKIWHFSDDFAKGRVFYEPFFEGKPGAISGIVRSSTGEVFAARVHAFDTTGIWEGEVFLSGDSVYTYVIENLNPGDYYVEVIAQGFVHEYYDNALDIANATLVSVTSEDTTFGIDFVLEKSDTTGTISGRVLDNNGNPILLSIVYAVPCGEEYIAGITIADSTGAYVIPNLEIGKKYYVFAQAPCHTGEFYANAYTVEDALKVPAGSEDIDFELSAVEKGGAGSIYGTITSAEKGSIEGCMIHILKGDTPIASVTSNANGKYGISGIAPGEYIVRASRAGYKSENYAKPIVIDSIGTYFHIGIDIELDEAGVEERKTPLSFWVSKPMPNIVKNSVSIMYSIPGKNPGIMKVYNITGSLVKSIVLPTGIGRAVWNLTDAKEREVVNGVYFLKISAGKFKKMMKITVVR